MARRIVSYAFERSSTQSGLTSGDSRTHDLRGAP